MASNRRIKMIHDFTIADGTGMVVRLDLQLALQALAGNNNSLTEPITKYKFMWWGDTTTNIIKIRNSQNNAWINFAPLDGIYPALTLQGRKETNNGEVQNITMPQLKTMLGTASISQGGTGQTTDVDAFNALKQNATDSSPGVVELATAGEAVLNSTATTIPNVAQTSAMVNQSSTGYDSIQNFPISGTWNRPSGITKIEVIVAGGGGGGSDYGGGGGGGTAIKLIDVTNISSVTVTIGNGGTGGSFGVNGTQSSFGDHCVGKGGKTIYNSGIAYTGPGGTATGGDVNIGGSHGARYHTYGTSHIGGNIGQGGDQNKPGGTGMCIVREYK